MKKVILFLFFVPVTLFCQITENFETGNLSRWVESVAGHWKADTIKSVSGRYSLHHVYDSPAAGNDQIGIPLTNLQPSMGLTRWAFKIRYENDPSSANNWGVFLISDKEPANMLPGGSVNGFVIGVNLSGNDDTLRLWKVKSGNLSVVLNTGIKWNNDAGINWPVTVNVERSQGGIWKTEVVQEGGIIIVSSSVVESELFNAEWFGVYYRYTATLDRLLRIDDIFIDGVFIEDTEPPAMIKCTAYTLNSLDLIFSEEPEEGFWSAFNFSLNASTEKAGSILKVSPVSIRINFETSFLNKEENTVLINSLCDRNENCIQNLIIRFTPVRADPGDIVISEIMADPLPAVSLPEKEYLELFNRTRFSFNLKNWKLITNGSVSSLPETIIKPDERMVLCQLQDTSLFIKFGRVTGVKSFPALIDDGRLLVLSDSLGNMINGVEYSSGWYGDNMKDNGGWSLEMIDPGFPFFDEGNWQASTSRNGGTPCSVNSVNLSNPDIFFQGIVNAFPGDSSYLTLSFSEPVKNIKETLSGIVINGNIINSVSLQDPLIRRFLIKPAAFFIRDQQYTLIIPFGVTDYAGNNPDVNTITFGLPGKVLQGDIQFNELMFNPLPEEGDYVELFNASDKIINTSDLYLVSVNESGLHSDPVPLSDENRLVLPGSYYAAVTDRKSLLSRYFSAGKSNVFQVDQLPSMPDQYGHLILYNRELDRIDEVIYNEKMHYSLLSGYEGISLEKVRPEISSSDSKNWHSASEVSGWGTPGALNSIFSVEPSADSRIIFSSTKISPDNDGNEDLLVIDLKPGGNGNVVTIRIYDETGALIRNLAENLLAGNQASLTWDGTDGNGSLVSQGIYIFLIEVFDDTGRRMKWKRVCSVIR